MPLFDYIYFIIVILKERRIIVIGLFTKKTSGRSAFPKAIAFVDYEHWFVSLHRNYGMKPDIGAWFNMISETVNLTDVFFFADFSHKSLSDEIKRIRLYSNKIIDTRNTTGSVAKDFTDFIILDNMYQKAIGSDENEVFILFTGDGHFASVCSFIKNIQGKEIWVYGIRNSFSRQLQETATKSVILPDEAALRQRNFKLILDAISKSEKTYPSLANISKAVSEANRVKPEEINEAIQTLVDKKYIIERNITLRGSAKRVVLFIDWDMLSKDGIYERTRSQAQAD